MRTTKCAKCDSKCCSSAAAAAAAANDELVTSALTMRNIVTNYGDNAVHFSCNYSTIRLTGAALHDNNEAVAKVTTPWPPIVYVKKCHFTAEIHHG